MTCPFCKIEHTIQVPIIHSNGTAAKVLLGEAQDCIDAVQEAIRRFGTAYPNGRDYYLIGGSIDRAMRQYQARVQAMVKAMNELVEIRDHIQCVMDLDAERKRR